MTHRRGRVVTEDSSLTARGYQTKLWRWGKVVMSPLHFLLLKKKKKKMLLSEKSFNFLFTEKHQSLNPVLEVELIGEKVSIERIRRSRGLNS
jgi:hypothetical protein